MNSNKKIINYKAVDLFRVLHPWYKFVFYQTSFVKFMNFTMLHQFLVMDKIVFLEVAEISSCLG